MAERSHPFSIFLLKKGFDETNSIVDDTGLEKDDDADSVPENGTLFILDRKLQEPWWKDYFGVSKDLKQGGKGALLFLKVKERCFVLSFGHVYHNLKEESYEYDFGLLVTLNSVEPSELKSTDILDPGLSKKKRTQVPLSNDLTYFDFDRNSEIIKSLTGRVKAKYKTLFANASGSDSLHVSVKLKPAGLENLCVTLLGLFESNEYKKTFPNIQNISPVKDPAKIAPLDEALMMAFRKKDAALSISIPEVVDFHEVNFCRFYLTGGRGKIYPEIAIDNLYSEMSDGEVDITEITLDQFKAFRVNLTDEDGDVRKSYGLYRCVFFDADIADELFHICDGKWYKVDRGYADELKNFIDARCENIALPNYDHDNDHAGKLAYSEENYNAHIPGWNGKFICLDQTDISPVGHTQIEPCDLYTVLPCVDAKENLRANLYHLKISTRSASLSHLFNQGVNSVELIKSEPEVLAKMIRLIEDCVGGNNATEYVKPLSNFQFKVLYGIITRKDDAGKSGNLPLFSKISLMRCMKSLELMDVKVALFFIKDASKAKDGHDDQHYVKVRVVEVGGKNVVYVAPGHGLPDSQKIKGCPKVITESPVGSEFFLLVKEKGGELSSFHSWKWESVK